MSERDEFPQRVKAQLAQRAGHRCSNPNCGIMTVGPSPGGEGIINVGIAAHITAAAPGGPRYDPRLTSEQRGSYDNGIWACEICGRAIDQDEGAFSVEVLREWKRQREARALSEVARGIFAPAAGLPQAAFEGPRTLDCYVEYTSEHNILFALHLYNPSREILTVTDLDLLSLPDQRPLPWGQGPMATESVMVGGRMIPGYRRIPFELDPENECIYLRYVELPVDTMRQIRDRLMARLAWRARRNPAIRGQGAAQAIYFERDEVGYPE